MHLPMCMYITFKSTKLLNEICEKQLFLIQFVITALFVFIDDSSIKLAQLSIQLCTLCKILLNTSHFFKFKSFFEFAV